MVIQLRDSKAARRSVLAPRFISLVVVAVVFAVLALILGATTLGQRNEWQQVKESVLKSVDGAAVAGEVDNFGKIIRRNDESEAAEEDAEATNFNYTPFIVGVVSAVCLLSLGIGIGYYLPRSSTADGEKVDADYVLTLLGGVGSWTHSLGEEMQDMRDMVDELVEQVGELSESERVTDTAAGSVAAKPGGDLDKIVAQLSTATSRYRSMIT